jgi:hypothetical protein
VKQKWFILLFGRLGIAQSGGVNRPDSGTAAAD